MSVATPAVSSTTVPVQAGSAGANLDGVVNVVSVADALLAQPAPIAAIPFGQPNVTTYAFGAGPAQVNTQGGAAVPGAVVANANPAAHAALPVQTGPATQPIITPTAPVTVPVVAATAVVPNTSLTAHPYVFTVALIPNDLVESVPFTS